MRGRSATSVMAIVMLAGALVAGCGGGGDAPSAADISQMSCHQLVGIKSDIPSSQDMANSTDPQGEMNTANAYLQRLVALGGCPSEPSLGGSQLPHLVPGTSQP